MKQLRNVLIFTLLLMTSVSANAADVMGMWMTETNEEGRSMSVEIFACGEKVCGKAVDIFGTDDKSNVGIEIIKGMKKKSETAFSKGRIYAPDTKKWYKSKMSLRGEDKLKVSGCVFGGLICRSQVWTRL